MDFKGEVRFNATPEALASMVKSLTEYNSQKSLAAELIPIYPLTDFITNDFSPNFSARMDNYFERFRESPSQKSLIPTSELRKCLNLWYKNLLNTTKYYHVIPLLDEAALAEKYNSVKTLDDLISIIKSIILWILMSGYEAFATSNSFRIISTIFLGLISLSEKYLDEFLKNHIKSFDIPSENWKNQRSIILVILEIISRYSSIPLTNMVTIYDIFLRVMKDMKEKEMDVASEMESPREMVDISIDYGDS